MYNLEFTGLIYPLSVESVVIEYGNVYGCIETWLLDIDIFENVYTKSIAVVLKLVFSILRVFCSTYQMVSNDKLGDGTIS